MKYAAILLLFLAADAFAQVSLTTEQCGVGSLCTYQGDRGSMQVTAMCDKDTTGNESHITIVNAQFGPKGYPVQCGDFAAHQCNNFQSCYLQMTNENCEADGVLPASIPYQVVMISCPQ